MEETPHPQPPAGDAVLEGDRLGDSDSSQQPQASNDPGAPLLNSEDSSKPPTETRNSISIDPPVIRFPPLKPLARSTGSGLEQVHWADSASSSPEWIQNALSQMYVANHARTIQPDEAILNPSESHIKEDIIRMIVQYLGDEGYNMSKLTILDEANVKWHERNEKSMEIRRLKKSILDGDWLEVEKLMIKPLVKNHKAFMYSIYKQQYLEYIEHHETQKAFTHLNKRLKPLEHLQTTPNEFKDLCYLLTAKSVQDAPSFKNWEGIGPSREKLADQLQIIADFETMDREGSVYVPPQRLLTLLQQAVAYQIEFARYHPKITPKVTTLLRDYESVIIPNAVRHAFVGHTGNVKCVEFVGEEGKQIVSGSSDNTLRVWDTETANCLEVLEGHTSRIWDVASNKSGAFVASASGDGTVKLWDLKGARKDCVATYTGFVGDVYSVQYHPAGHHLVAGGYDKTIRLYDLERNVVVKTFTGHQLSVSKTIFNPIGNLIISGSKDNTIKFWDIVSGLCIKTISSHLGEVTSVEMNSVGSLMLSCSKDNSNRLWDVRMVRPVRKFKGHQNTSKNFIRARFMGNSMVVGGSECGLVHLWDHDHGEVIQRLRGHGGVVFDAKWNSKQSLLVSCGDDKKVLSWWFDERRVPLFED
ncbi:WD40-repeat-containing domain protein [Polychytrium aggregatum]|uniref:WD40-repeat-containing domain protein n=1 Tax=Polychytrium aggregatum TaxID=110093 RepID=UPI0022FDF24D|nr:WD40-repeat-containing domain protein [Polychytrium aggregatum]KAI9206639.1 WD40-repeat-containing domain protein [Polychytrium aggregatum]